MSVYEFLKFNYTVEYLCLKNAYKQVQPLNAVINLNNPEFRKRGRTKLRWVDNIARDLRSCQVSENDKSIYAEEKYRESGPLHQMGIIMLMSNQKERESFNT